MMIYRSPAMFGSPVLTVPEDMGRPSWDETYLMMTLALSLRGECSKRQVAAMIVSAKNKILTGGINGVAPGAESCLTGACPRSGTDAPEGSSYDTGPFACIAAHAEANALHRADWDEMQGGTIYISAWPCGGCLKQIMTSGLARIVYLLNGERVSRNTADIDIAKELAA